MRISDWSSDVCSSDLPAGPLLVRAGGIRFLSDGPGHAPTDFRGRGAGFASRCAGVGGVAPTYGGRGRRSGLKPRRLSGRARALAHRDAHGRATKVGVTITTGSSGRGRVAYEGGGARGAVTDHNPGGG